MRKAWIENGIVRDVAPAGLDPVFLYGPEIGANYTEDVPDDAEHGWIQNENGQWVAPPPIPTPEPTPNPVPQVVTPRQARLVLALTPSGDENFPTMLAKVEAAFNSLPEPDKTVAQITWEYSTEVQRSNPLIAQMQTVIGFTDEQIDQLFIQAATL